MTADKLYNKALLLAYFTVAYNLVEGIVSSLFGFEDESLALFGFGLDSFIEVMSGVGIIWMVKRISNNPLSDRSEFEKTALKVTGTSFYVLTAGLVLTAAHNIWQGVQPESTVWGIIISSLSLLIMYFLYRSKLGVGQKLDSKPIITDAKCTKVCFYMSFVLLASSLLYWAFGIGYLDSLGALGLAYYSYSEGKESFEKARGIECHDCC
jgi:divalent metal cation (Fe/Co/Zn/Cd) transporter